MIHTHLFICHHLYIILTTDNVVKSHAFSSVQTRNIQLHVRGGGWHSSTFFCVISGFCDDVHEICDYLGFYAA